MSLHGAHNLNFDMVPQLAVASTTALGRPARALARAAAKFTLTTAAQLGPAPTAQPDTIPVPAHLFRELQRRMTGEVSAARERDALLLRNADLEQRIADLESELASLIVPDDLDLVPIKVALAAAQEIDSSMGYDTLLQLYHAGDVIGQQKGGKWGRVKICRNSVKRHLRPRPKLSAAERERCRERSRYY